MRISWNWLQRYVDTGLTPQQAAEVLTSTGLETESVELFEPVKGMLKGVVVGHVLKSAKHPDADRLSICTVDLGNGEPVQIVCGAPNVAQDQKVLVATIGTTLHMKDGTSIMIKKSKIRGQESQGMICAEVELGLGNDHDGIFVLDPAAEVGSSASDHLGFNSDHVLEIGLTPNRTDAMGHVGVARDLIAALNHRRGMSLELKLPDVSNYGQDVEGNIVKVEVADRVACPRYAGVTLANIRVGPSPKWLKDLLLAIGVKPINNVVDVTNFVQHELGQPLHAFDADRLEGNRIVVRKAGDREKFTTLDGKARDLDRGDLVIADGRDPACIAGVFGGERSGVSEGTERIFLESAYFDPSSIRATARRHGLNTDASFRFERGVDPEITIYALERAALLIKEIAGAVVASPVVDINSLPKTQREVHIQYSEIEKLTGLVIPKDDVVRILESLDFRIKDRNDRGIQVTVPHYRTDVYRPADVVEEILRIHGFDHVPLPERLMVPPVLHEPFNLESLRHQLGVHLASRGMREIMTASLTSGEKLARNGISLQHLVKLRNPLSAELDVLRPSMLPGMLQTIAHNINRQQRDLHFFEQGRIYRVENGSAVETETLSLSITGMKGRGNWRSVDRKVVLMDLKEEVGSLLSRAGIHGGVDYDQKEQVLLTTAHELHVKGRRIGSLGEVDQAVLKHFDIAQPVFYAELDQQAILHLCRSGKIEFKEISRFPAVRRDLSMLLGNEIRFSQLQKLAFNAERKLLQEVDLFDVYQGEKLPAGKKSYALSFILQDQDKTLTDEQVEKAMSRIRQAFEKEAGAEIRA